MLKVKILRNKIIKPADPEVSAGDCNDGDGSNIGGATEQAELTSVLGEPLSLCPDLYTQLVESNIFEDITPPPASSPKGPQEEEEVQQQQQQELMEESQQQQRPRLRRGHKCINKEVVKLVENPPSFSQSTEEELKSGSPSDDEEIECGLNSEVKCAIINFKKELHEMLKRNNNEEENMRSEVAKLRKRLDFCLKRIREIENEKDSITDTLKRLKK